MLITLSRRAAICQSVAEVQLTGVAPLGAVSHRFNLIIFKEDKSVWPEHEFPALKSILYFLLNRILICLFALQNRKENQTCGIALCSRACVNKQGPAILLLIKMLQVFYFLICLVRRIGFKKLTSDACDPAGFSDCVMFTLGSLWNARNSSSQGLHPAVLWQLCVS